MAFGLKSFGFKGRAGAPENLPENVRQALESWRASPAPALDEPHFHTRYVVIDVATTGPRAEEDELLGISAVGLQSRGYRCGRCFCARSFQRGIRRCCGSTVN